MGRKQAVEFNPQNTHKRNEETSKEKQSPDNKADAQEVQQPSIAVGEQQQMQVETSRPRRERRRPSYLQDYVANLAVILLSVVYMNPLVKSWAEF